MKKWIYRIIGLALVLAAGWGGYRFLKQLPERQERIATTRVRRGDVIIRTYARGELQAVRSVTLTAPNLFGTVQVTRLAPAGSLAHESDLIVEFDDSERRAALEEDLLEVEQIDEQIKKALADLSIRDNQDQVDLLSTRYAVRRAELEVKRNPIISAIDAKKNLLTLEEQRRRLQQLENDIKSRKQQAQAQIAVLREQRNKSMIDVHREQDRIAQAKVLSPMTGLVAVRQNRSGYFNFGQQIPDIREGDNLSPGMPVADVLDLSELELVAKVGELDRANLHEGQDVIMQLDAVPDKKFHGKIKGMSGTASADVFSGDPAKKFDVVFSIDMRQLLAGLGVKPAEIERIMTTAAQNARKAPKGMGGFLQGSAGPMRNAAPGPPMGDAAGEGMPGAMASGGPQGVDTGGAGEGGSRRGGGRGNVSPEMRQQFQAALQKELGGKNIQDLSPEERQKVMTRVRAAMGGGAGRQGGGRPAQGAGAPQRPSGPPAILPAGGNEPTIPFRSPWTDAQLSDAKLPPPPEEDSDLQVLLRPGLLADVEIIVEKIPSALHVPAQAVFEKNGQMVVYVQQGSRFEERSIQIAKRSESTLVLAGGVKEGEVVALSDPTAGTARKGEKKSKGGGQGMGGMQGGGGR